METECNGLLTYDRLFKVDPERMLASNQALVASSSSRIGGSARIARAIASLCFSDPRRVELSISC